MIILRINFTTLSHEFLTPARSAIKGSRVFASAGGFPERSGLRHQPTHQSEHIVLVVRWRTFEEIGDPDIYPNLFSEVVRNNPRIGQGKAEDVREEDDCLCLGATHG